MAMGLGAFTEGLQSGMAARDKMDIARQYKRRLADENDRNDWKWQEDINAARDNYYMEHGNSLEGFVEPERTKDKDPALIRFGKWLGGKMGFVNEEAGAQEAGQWVPPTVNGPKHSPIPESAQQPQKLFADGGRVAGRDRYGRTQAPQNYGLPEEEPPRDSLGAEVVNMGLDDYTLPEDRGNAFPRTRAAAADKRDYERRMHDEYMQKPFNAYNVGEHVREQMGSDIVGHGRTALAFGRDVVDNLVPDALAEGVQGFLGIDGDQPQNAPAPTGDVYRPGGEHPVPENFDPDMKLYPDEEKAATDATSPAPRRSDNDIAEQAMDDGQMMALENLDYKRLVDSGMRPNDLPQMSTAEWADYRSNLFRREIAYGKSASDAYKVVDDMTVGIQMRGMQRELNKAFLYMQAGQMQEAAMALSMGYQYFPNGAKMEIATMDDPKSGRPVLVARAYNEDTGEPTGTPVVITADRLNAMAENMSNPAAFRTWTKDGHQLQLDIAKHKESVSHNSTMEDIYGYNAETSRMNAESRRMAAEQGALGGVDFDASEQRQRSQMYMQEMERLMMADGYGEHFEDPRVRQGMVNTIDTLQMRYPTASPGQLIELTMRAFDGGMKQGGVEAAMRAVEGLLAVQEKG